MARNGSGVMSIPNPDFVAGTTIVSGDVDANFSTIVDEITNSIAADGQTTPTANLPMGGFKLTGLGTGTSATDSVHLRDVQYQAWSWGGTAAGTADALTLSPSPAIAAYAAGQAFRFIAASNNTGAVTVNVSAVGAKAIQNNGGALAANEIVSGEMYEIIYDGTQFQLLHIVRQTIGVDVQAQSAVLDDLDTLGAAAADGEVIVATGAGAFAYESGATLRTSIGVGTGDTPQFTGLDLESTDAGASSGPTMELYRNSISPAAFDGLGIIVFSGEDSAGAKKTYAQINAGILDPAAGAENARIIFRTTQAGTNAFRMVLENGLYMQNATGGDKGADTINASGVYDDGRRLSSIFLTRLTASASASLSYTATPSDAKRLICRIQNLIPATDDVELWLRVMQSSSVVSGATDYRYRVRIAEDSGVTMLNEASASDSKILLASTSSLGGLDSAGSGWCGTVIIEGPNATGVNKEILFNGRYQNNNAGTDRSTLWGGGTLILNTSAIEGPWFGMSSGNITSGTVDIYAEL